MSSDVRKVIARWATMFLEDGKRILESKGQENSQAMAKLAVVEVFSLNLFRGDMVAGYGGGVLMEMR